MYDDPNNELLQLLKRAAYVAGVCVATIALLLLCSCKHCEPLTIVRDSIQLRYRLDSVFLYKHDSIWRDRYIKGDTVFITNERWSTRYKDKIEYVHDTLRINNEVVKTEQVKYIPKFYKNCTIGFWLTIVAVVLYIVFKLVIKFYFRK